MSFFHCMGSECVMSTVMAVMGILMWQSVSGQDTGKADLGVKWGSFRSCLGSGLECTGAGD